jgi:hypothetical protein
MLNGLRLVGSVCAFAGLGAAVAPPDVAQRAFIPPNVVHSDVVPHELSPRIDACIPVDQCCKLCSKGKACGNTCIRRSYECHKGRGCACDADEVCN